MGRIVLQRQQEASRSRSSPTRNFNDTTIFFIEVQKMNAGNSNNKKRASTSDGAGSSSPAKKSARSVIIPSSTGSSGQGGSRAVQVAPQGLELLATTSSNLLDRSQTATTDAAAELTAAGQEITAITVETLPGASTEGASTAGARRGINLDVPPPRPVVCHCVNNIRDEDLLAPLFVMQSNGTTSDIEGVDPKVEILDSMFRRGEWPKGKKWAIGGDLLHKKVMKLDDRPPRMPYSSDDEDSEKDRPYTGPNGVVARRMWKRGRAEYLYRVASALMDMVKQDWKEGKIIFPTGVVVKKEVWRGSTFQTPRKRLPAGRSS